MLRDAVFSACGTFRYRLDRAWGDSDKYLNIIALNPSTADHRQDDPTIRRCIAFARREQFSGLYVTNLYAFRATHPKDLFAAADPEGPDNWHHLTATMQCSHAVLFAWGNHGLDSPLTDRLLQACPQAQCLGLNKSGAPKHPLYIRADQPFVAYH